MVHMASSWMSRESEVEDGRSDGVQSGVVEVGRKYSSVSCNFILSP
jgi:hypothetical protein